MKQILRRRTRAERDPQAQESIFWAITDVPDSLPDRRRLALQRCNGLIGWYEDTKSRHRRRYYGLQIATIALGGLTPILVLWTDLPKPIQALPAALASIAAGLAGVFQSHEQWVRSAAALESLRSERMKYLGRAGEDYAPDVEEQEAFRRFVLRMEAIVATHVQDWRASRVER